MREVIAQLLATEGFSDVEEIAYVDLGEIAVIEGFDEDTAEEIQARARDYLDRLAAEQDAKRKELGVEDGVLEIEGVDLAMAVKFGENDVKTVDDLAGLVTDDLRGWFENRNGERVREPGILEDFNLSADDAEMMIMRARVAAGWISEEDLPQPAVEEVEADDGDEGVFDVENMDLAALEAEAEALGLDLDEAAEEEKETD